MHNYYHTVHLILQAVNNNSVPVFDFIGICEVVSAEVMFLFFSCLFYNALYKKNYDYLLISYYLVALIIRVIVVRLLLTELLLDNLLVGVPSLSTINGKYVFAHIKNGTWY